VRRQRDGAILRTADQSDSGERLSIRLAEAELEVIVDAVTALPRSEKLL
jgi:hypothetical protein